MKKDLEYLINQLLKNPSFNYESLNEYLKNHPELIRDFKEEIIKDEQNENHELIKQFILIQSSENRKEIFDEICKIYRKPFITHKSSLSRVVIANEEIFLHILRNDKRFFKDGPENTSVDSIEEKIGVYLNTLYPNSFSKQKSIRKKEIYDALANLEDTSDPPLITTAKLRPGTGTGTRRRKRYCLSDEGINQIIPIISLVIRDQLDDFRLQI